MKHLILAASIFLFAAPAFAGRHHDLPHAAMATKAPQTHHRQRDGWRSVSTQQRASPCAMPACSRARGSQL